MRAALAIVALAVLAGPRAAQITTGQYTDGAGYSARVEVSDTNGAATAGVDVTLTDSGGSVAVNGTQASTSTDAAPQASAFPSSTTPRGTAEVRGRNGKVEKKNASGQWVPMRKVKQKRPKKVSHFVAGGAGPGAFAPAPSSPSLPIILGPGEEVTSLPDPGAQYALSSPGK